MVRRKGRLLTLLVLIAALACSLAFAAVLAAGGTTVEDEYEYGSVFDVPAGYTLLFPGGEQYGKGEVTLSEEGIYTLRSDEGAEDTFTVRKELFSVTGSGSSVQWGTYKASEHGGDAYDVTGEVTGWQVALAPGGTFTYNKVIDVTGKTIDDIFVDFALTPQTIGRRDVSQMYIVLTDAYDPTMKMTIELHPTTGVNADGTEQGIAYLKAGVFGTMAGKEWWNPSNQQVHVDNAFGAIVFLSFNGTMRNSDPLGPIDTNVVSLAYDDAAKQLFAKHNTEFTSNAGNPMVDFDSEEFFDELWSGFTTGECFLSISASSYEADTFNFVLTDIGYEKLSETPDETRAAPDIVVDYGPYSAAELPQALQGSPYPLFAASCRSPYYGGLPVTAQVLFGGEPVAVENGAFVPAQPGEYTIVYTVKDNFGETFTENVTVTAIATAEAMTVTPTISFDTELTVGDLIRFTDPIVENAIGEAEIFITVTHGTQTDEVEGNVYRVPAEGEYTVTFTAIDYVGREVSADVAFHAERGNKAVFTEPDVTVPRYFIAGKAYELPVVYATNFTDGSGSRVLATAYVEDCTGRRVSKGGLVTPHALQSGDTVSIVYVARIPGGEPAELVFDGIPVLEVGNGEGGLSFDRFFYPLEGDPAVTLEENVVLSSQHSRFSADFINPLLADSFNFTFAAGGNVNKVTVRLTSYTDASQSIEFTYERSGSTTHFYVNGDAERWYDVERSMNNDLTVTYDASTKTVQFRSGGSSVSVPSTLAGEAFGGFYGEKVYATIYAEGADEVLNKTLTCKYICGQALTDDAYEFIQPLISISGDYGGMRSKDSVITLGRAIAVDVVDPYTEVSITVRTPSDAYATAQDGTLLNGADADKDYKIVLSEYGRYMVSYVAEDESGNRRTSSYSVTVSDETAPVLSLRGSVPQEATVGERVVLPGADVTDDMDEEVALHITVFTGSGKTVLLDGQTRAFTPQVAGEYTILYWAIDAAGNMSTAEYRLTVSERG